MDTGDRTTGSEPWATVCRAETRPPRLGRCLQLILRRGPCGAPARVKRCDRSGARHFLVWAIVDASEALLLQMVRLARLNIIVQGDSPHTAATPLLPTR